MAAENDTAVGVCITASLAISWIVTQLRRHWNVIRYFTCHLADVHMSIDEFIMYTHPSSLLLVLFECATAHQQLDQSCYTDICI